MSLVIEQVVEQMKSLPPDLQQRVLVFVRQLVVSTQKGTPGEDLLQFAGTLDQEEAERIQQAIEEGCEQIADEW